MSKVYRPYQPEQSELLPPSPREWLPEEHWAYFILDTVKEMDLKVLLEKLLLYGSCVGVASSRKLEKGTYEDVAFRIIAAGQHPDHTAIAEFRRRHLKELSGLCVQVLALCQKAGLVKLGHVALDGTKLKANAINQWRGFRQLLLRGLAKARGQWALICLTHNLLRLYRASVAAGGFRGASRRRAICPTPLNR
jgi:transposase